ncbi:hypothetical protein F0P96_18555 [Hymenobacter busanensis]|uniref:HEPN/Toprim N-terminal domain-containing protein n=1 Tax=Hymenobacter busanensis TaxID=2607656 RepID=A0A7L4ZS80_9BACT|nr:HEPN/Toprim-associated domain-containing protein [Hymenobacter busanensis]KAA9327235.1 hypothetical protein F0P96_18555 [Hymenobacter busanensis]QHJ05901.1 hypothetical protein GUY19_00760 [Hymenobacter busanensis]
MGSMITLRVNGLQLDWGKNHGYRDYSNLFLPSDRKKVPYSYADEVEEHKLASACKLKDVKARLDLIGYSLAKLESIYEVNLRYIYGADIKVEPKVLFDWLSQVNINNYKYQGYIEYEMGNFLYQELINYEPFIKHCENNALTEFDVVYFCDLLDPLVLLRLFAENDKNQDIWLEWHTADLIEGGWATESELTGGVAKEGKFLIVTEGNTDTFIIKKAMEMTRPDVAGFFTFIDMEDGYPFTGSGNLFRFCQGLVSIGIQNKVLVIFDNDIEGNDKYNKIAAMKLPTQMKVMKLPHLVEFTSFTTVGPIGESVENINGKAVAIECFLDLQYKMRQIPKVRWTNYVKECNCYHGSLENKEDYIRKFKHIKSIDDKYNFSKLSLLIDAICKACS